MQRSRKRQNKQDAASENRVVATRLSKSSASDWTMSTLRLSILIYGLHSMAILEALNHSDSAPPVIALTTVGEAEATPIARRYFAACLPAETLAAANSRY